MTSSDSPLLSVIVPVYNTAPFLPRCLDSLLGQTYRNLEIICVNDGSTDDSAAILDAYAAKASRIKVIHQENAGVSAARNRGIDVAKGALITFVDGDDWLEPDAYAKVVAAMVDGVDLVCFGMCIDGEIPLEKRKSKEEYYRIRYTGKINCGSSEILATDASSSNKAYRRSLIEQYKLRYIEGMAYGEDAAFYVCYAAVARLTCYLPEKLYHYVQRAKSAMDISAQRHGRCIDHLLVVRGIGSFYRSLQMPAHRADLLVRVFSRFYDFAAWHTPLEMREVVDDEAYRIGKEYGLLFDNRFPVVRRVRSMTDNRFVKLFHWYVDNRECYGFCGRAICSITYEPEQVVYRLFGKCVKTIRMPERA